MKAGDLKEVMSSVPDSYEILFEDDEGNVKRLSGVRRAVYDGRSKRILDPDEKRKSRKRVLVMTLNDIKEYKKHHRLKALRR